MTNQNELIDLREAAARLRQKPKTLTNWVSVKKPGFPPGRKIGRKRFWRVSEIEGYIDYLSENAS